MFKVQLQILFSSLLFSLKYLKSENQHLQLSMDTGQRFQLVTKRISVIKNLKKPNIPLQIVFKKPNIPLQIVLKKNKYSTLNCIKKPQIFHSKLY